MSDAVHAVKPFRVTGDAGAAMARLAALIETQEGARIVTQRADYLHAEYQSKLMGFVDDLEFAGRSRGARDPRAIGVAPRATATSASIARASRRCARRSRRARHESARKLERGAALRLSSTAPARRPSPARSRAELFQRLAGEAEAQATRSGARSSPRKGHPAPAPFVPDSRTRFVAWLVGRLGPRPLQGRAGRDEGARHGDLRLDACPAMPVTRLPVAGGGVEHRHRGLGGGGNLRAAVFGDQRRPGLQREPDPRRRGCVVRSARRRAYGRGRHGRRRVRDGRGRIRVGALAARALRAPDRPRARRVEAVSGGRSAGARADLRGQGPARRRKRARLAQRLVADPEHALDTLAREELGLNPAELGSPIGAATSSFVSFAAGAVLPLAPFLLIAPVPAPCRRRSASRPSRCSSSAPRCRCSPAATRCSPARGCWRSARSPAASRSRSARAALG